MPGTPYTAYIFRLVFALLLGVTWDAAGLAAMFIGGGGFFGRHVGDSQEYKMEDVLCMGVSMRLQNSLLVDGQHPQRTPHTVDQQSLNMYS